MSEPSSEPCPELKYGDTCRVGNLEIGRYLENGKGLAESASGRYAYILDATPLPPDRTVNPNMLPDDETLAWFLIENRRWHAGEFEGDDGPFDDVDDVDDGEDEPSCPWCGGGGLAEYDDSPEVWGEDFPQTDNHLITCPQCRGTGLMKNCSVL